MTQPEFEAALDRWGADLSRWPARQARLAEAHLAASPDAHRSLMAARRSEAYLGGLQHHQAPARLADRITAAAAHRQPDPLERLATWLSGAFWRPAALASVLLLSGYLTGISTHDNLDTELADSVATLAFTDLYLELDDVQP
jgi:hypothetical protein